MRHLDDKVMGMMIFRGVERESAFSTRVQDYYAARTYALEDEITRSMSAGTPALSLHSPGTG
jgi:hypothetical protein